MAKGDSKGDAIIDICCANQPSTPILKWKKGMEICFVLVTSIVGGILLYCLLTLCTVVVVSTFLIINTIIHIIDSMKGDAGHRKVVSPISDIAATLILLLAIITCSIWFGIVEAIPHWKHQILLGLQIGKWVKILIIVFGYCSIRTGTQIMIVSPWFQGILEAAHCVLVLPAAILIMKVTGFGDLVITRRWIRAVVLIIVAQNALSIIGHTIVFLSEMYWCGKPNECKGPKCVFYYIKGLRRSLTFVMVSLMHLIVWSCYFEKSWVANKASDFIGTWGWTFLCELICGVLWLIKNFILLSWKAHTVYDRSNEEILRKLTQWYCLHSLQLIKLRKPCSDNSDSDSATKPADDSIWARYRVKSAINLLWDKMYVNTQNKNQETEREEKWTATNEALKEVVSREEKEGGDEINRSKHGGKRGSGDYKDCTLSIHEKEMIARAFLPGDTSLPDDLDISDFCQKWRTKYNLDKDYRNSDHHQSELKEPIQDCIQRPRQSITEKELVESLTDLYKIHLNKASNVLYKRLQETNKSTHTAVYAEDFQTWMERAWQNCLQLRYLLAASQQVVKFLNRLMIGFIIALVIIIWLVLTEILTTKVLLVITSPLLAATFIFGDTLKTMFQGIVFAYMMHPFTIGDLCVIDQTQMEVKSIGIWRTRFSKVGTEEEVMYPNSVLASQAIINYEGDTKLLRRDFVEFSLDYDTKATTITSLKDSIRCIEYIKSQESESILHKSEGHAAREDDQQNASTSSEGRGEIQEDVPDKDDLQHSGSEPSAHVRIAQESGTDYQLLKLSARDDDVMVKQIQDKIIMTVHFNHKKTITDMTTTQAFIEKVKRKSEILEEIAKLVSEQLPSKSNGHVQETKAMDDKKKN